VRRFVLYVLLALVVGGVLGTLMRRDSGYVLVSYDRLSVETSVWAALFTLVALYFVTRGVIYLATRFFRTGGELKDWNQRRRERGARRQTIRGLLRLGEGDWAAARKSLLAAAPEAETPLVNYLSAARAANELDDSDGRDEYLIAAQETTPCSQIAVSLTRVELQLAKGQVEQALATALELRKESPRHPKVLSLLRDCYVAAEDWPAVIDLLGGLKKTMSDEALLALTRKAWTARVEAAQKEDGAAQSAGELEDLWSSLPKELRSDVALVTAYTEALLNVDAIDAAEAQLRRVLNHDWDDGLAGLYGRIRSSDPKHQRKAAEGWLKQRRENAIALLTLGRLNMMNEEWIEARKHLEASLDSAASADVYGELGRLCMALGEVERGAEYLALSLGESGAVVPDLPLPSDA
jgi:HemY protein